MDKQFFRYFLEADDGAGGGDATLVDLAKEGDDSLIVDLGERPEWCPEKFWDGEKNEVRTETAFTSFAEMERDYQRVKQDLPSGVPKETSEYFTDNIIADGKVILPEGLQNQFEVAVDNPMLTKLADNCKEIGISVEQFEKLVPAYYQAADEAQGPPINLEDELSRLGPNSKSMVKTNMAYLDSLKAQGVLSEEQHSKAEGVFMSYAEGVQVLDALRLASGHKPIPPGDKEVTPKFTAEELHARIGDERYGVDEAFTKETDEAHAEFYGTGNSGISKPSSVGVNAAMIRDRQVRKDKFKMETP